MDGNLSSYVGEPEAILPDGWTPETDIFAGADNHGEADNTLEQVAGDVREDGGELAKALKVSEEQRQELQNETPAPEQQTEQQQTEQPKGRKLTIKVNHKSEEIDVDAMSDADLTALLQKGRAYDAIKRRQDAEKYRSAYHAELDAGSSDAVARLIAEREAGGVFPLDDEQEQEPEQQQEASAAVGGRDLRGEVEQLRDLYGLKEIPDEVSQAVARGAPVLSAYAAYRDRELTKKISALEAENKVLKQNAANRSKAPVKGTSGGGAGKVPDIFEMGFDSGQTWNW